MTIRIVAACLAVAATAACGGQSHDSASHRSATAYLVLVQATYGPARYSRVGAPIDALTVSGTIANRGHAPLACGMDSFIVTDRKGESFTAVATSCEVPEIAPGNASSFSATFRTPLQRQLQLHFEHGDGTYEVRELRLHS